VPETALTSEPVRKTNENAEDGAPGRVSVPWCISEDKLSIAFYHVLDSESESTGYAEGTGQTFKATLDRVCLVLANMSKTAQRWNMFIPDLVQSGLQARLDAVAKREDFLRVFKEQFAVSTIDKKY